MVKGCVGSVKVSMVAFQAVVPAPTPGHRRIQILCIALIFSVIFECMISLTRYCKLKKYFIKIFRFVR